MDLAEYRAVLLARWETAEEKAKEELVEQEPEERTYWRGVVAGLETALMELPDKLNGEEGE